MKTLIALAAAALMLAASSAADAKGCGAAEARDAVRRRQSTRVAEAR